MDTTSQALYELGLALRDAGYHFVTPTPETHRRVIARRTHARDLRDVFGWSLPFERALLAPALFDRLVAAGACDEEHGRFRARVRFSSLGGGLYVHSAYPTVQSDAVFFGPDTYRFCRMLTALAPRARTLVDIGCGSGAGGLVAAEVAGAARVVLVDVNERALAFAGVNARLVGREVERIESDVLTRVDGSFDLIVANPPYMRDEGARVYRDGGGRFGEALSLRIVREALSRLAPGGSLLLYTGTAVVAGEDVFHQAVHPLLSGYEARYEEIDPDVFGEELSRPGYERVERIAAIALCVRKPVR